jgi:hypothetical protein
MLRYFQMDSLNNISVRQVPVESRQMKSSNLLCSGTDAVCDAVFRHHVRDYYSFPHVLVRPGCKLILPVEYHPTTRSDVSSASFIVVDNHVFKILSPTWGCGPFATTGASFVFFWVLSCRKLGRPRHACLN